VGGGGGGGRGGMVGVGPVGIAYNLLVGATWRQTTTSIKYHDIMLKYILKLI